jgi:hypothetical protein
LDIIVIALPFHSDTYGAEVAKILSLDDARDGARPTDLYPHACTSETARTILLKADAAQLFPGARDPESALSGLFLYFSCLKEAHELLHTFNGIDGAYWHGIMHRMEGDAFNAGYWFRRIGRHPVFPALQREAAQLGYAPGREWDPIAFTGFCERRTDEDVARRVQLVEWQLLFNYCASPVNQPAGAVIQPANSLDQPAPGVAGR